nr:immunoglobulin heavy chain junction region [Mus musculus]
LITTVVATCLLTGAK